MSFLGTNVRLGRAEQKYFIFLWRLGNELCLPAWHNGSESLMVTRFGMQDRICPGHFVYFSPPSLCQNRVYSLCHKLKHLCILSMVA